jgi:hypothetical protein
MSKWRQECDKRLAVPPDRHTYSFERCVGDRMSACNNNHPLGKWCNFFESTYTEDEDLLGALRFPPLHYVRTIPRPSKRHRYHLLYNTSI